MRYTSLFAACLFFLGALCARADDGTPLTFYILDKAVPFLGFASTGMTFSKNCRSTGGKLDCEALRVLGTLSLNRIPNELREGGVEPGGLLCDQAKGSSVYAYVDGGSARGFCKFSDSSLIGFEGLIISATVNDLAISSVAPYHMPLTSSPSGSSK